MGAALLFLIAAAVFVVIAYMVAYAIAGVAATGYVAAKIAEKTLGKADPEAVGKAIGFVGLVIIVICVILGGLLFAAERHAAATGEYKEISRACYGSPTRVRRTCEAARAYPHHPRVVLYKYERCCELPWYFDLCPVPSDEWFGSYCPWKEPPAPDPGRFVLLSADLAESMHQIREFERTELEMPSFRFSPDVSFGVRETQEKLIADAKRN